MKTNRMNDLLNSNHQLPFYLYILQFNSEWQVKALCISNALKKQTLW